MEQIQPSRQEILPYLHLLTEAFCLFLHPGTTRSSNKKNTKTEFFIYTGFNNLFIITG